jgi:hypothetical protein
MSGRTGDALELPGAFRRFPQRSASSQYRFSPVRLEGWHIRRDLPEASISLSLLPHSGGEKT